MDISPPDVVQGHVCVRWTGAREEGNECGELGRNDVNTVKPQARQRGPGIIIRVAKCLKSVNQSLAFSCTLDMGLIDAEKGSERRWDFRTRRKLGVGFCGLFSVPQTRNLHQNLGYRRGTDSTEGAGDEYRYSAVHGPTTGMLQASNLHLTGSPRRHTSLRLKKMP